MDTDLESIINIHLAYPYFVLNEILIFKDISVVILSSHFILYE